MASRRLAHKSLAAFFFSDTRKRGFRLLLVGATAWCWPQGWGRRSGRRRRSAGTGERAGMPGSGGGSHPSAMEVEQANQREAANLHGQRGFLILDPSAQTQWTHLVPGDGKPHCLPHVEP